MCHSVCILAIRRNRRKRQVCPSLLEYEPVGDHTASFISHKAAELSHMGTPSSKEVDNVLFTLQWSIQLKLDIPLRRAGDIRGQLVSVIAPL
jgi:hypothetical protein